MIRCRTDVTSIGKHGPEIRSRQPSLRDFWVNAKQIDSLLSKMRPSSERCIHAKRVFSTALSNVKITFVSLRLINKTCLCRHIHPRGKNQSLRFHNWRRWGEVRTRLPAIGRWNHRRSCIGHGDVTSSHSRRWRTHRRRNTLDWHTASRSQRGVSTFV